MKKSTKFAGIFGLLAVAVGGSIAYQRKRKPSAIHLSEDDPSTPVNYPPLGVAPAPEKKGPKVKAKDTKKKKRGKTAKRRAKDKAKNQRMNGRKK